MTCAPYDDAMVSINAALPVNNFFTYTQRTGVPPVKAADGIQSGLPHREQGADKRQPSLAERQIFKFKPLETGCRYDVRV